MPLFCLPPSVFSTVCIFAPLGLDPALFLGSKFVRAQLRAGWTKKSEATELTWGEERKS